MITTIAGSLHSEEKLKRFERRHTFKKRLLAISNIHAFSVTTLREFLVQIYLRNKRLMC